jgi:hypothetical protein
LALEHKFQIYFILFSYLLQHVGARDPELGLDSQLVFTFQVILFSYHFHILAKAGFTACPYRQSFQGKPDWGKGKGYWGKPNWGSSGCGKGGFSQADWGKGSTPQGPIVVNGATFYLGSKVRTIAPFDRKPSQSATHGFQYVYRSHTHGMITSGTQGIVTGKSCFPGMLTVKFENVTYERPASDLSTELVYQRRTIEQCRNAVRGLEAEVARLSSKYDAARKRLLLEESALTPLDAVHSHGSFCCDVAQEFLSLHPHYLKAAASAAELQILMILIGFYDFTDF